MLPPIPRDCSSGLRVANGLRDAIESSKNDVLMPPRIGPTPGCVTMSTNVLPGSADSAAN